MDASSIMYSEYDEDKADKLFNGRYLLKKEIGKLGGELEITEDSLALKSCTGLNQNARISTYDDHRMAMAFAPLATRIPLVIEDPEVVVKSYPEFWTHFNAVAYGTI